ncbi:MAG: DUF5610 domain-containing protein, partial [bacterium]
TGFLGAYRLNHASEKENEQVNGFTSLIREAIKKGFDEAIGVLGGLEDLGSVATNIKKTYDLVMQGLDEFQQERLDLLGEAENAPVTTKPFLVEEVEKSREPKPEESDNGKKNGDQVDLTA